MPCGAAARCLLPAIAEQMRRKGYTEATEQPDLGMIDETTSANRVESNPVRVGVGIGSWVGSVSARITQGSLEPAAVSAAVADVMRSFPARPAGQ